MGFEKITLEHKRQVLEELADIKALFASRNWFPGTSGNLSMRVGEFDPEQFYFAVTASGRINRFARRKISCLWTSMVKRSKQQL